MKLVKEYINEKFTEDSDPIDDMGIGVKHLIEKWLNHHNIKKNNYVINDDGTIDVNQNIDIQYTDIEKFPEYINFNIVDGNFSLSNNKNFISMRGFPKKITGYINVTNTAIQTLEYLPQDICSNFFKYNDYSYGYGLCFNELNSLEGLPRILKGSLWIQYNKIDTLEGIPDIIFGSLWIDNKFTEKEIRRVCDVKGKINLV